MNVWCVPFPHLTVWIQHSGLGEKHQGKGPRLLPSLCSSPWKRCSSPPTFKLVGRETGIREHSSLPFKDPSWYLHYSPLLTYCWSEVSDVATLCCKRAWEMHSGRPCAQIKAITILLYKKENEYLDITINFCHSKKEFKNHYRVYLGFMFVLC